jgi:hypothetical protein
MRKSKIIICAIMVAMVSIFLVACSGHGESSAQSKTGTKTLNGSYVYEWIDKDTGVHYWIYSETSGYAGHGGITPRLNADGSVMVTVE